jgi:hypothetical protein
MTLLIVIYAIVIIGIYLLGLRSINEMNKALKEHGTTGFYASELARYYNGGDSE